MESIAQSSQQIARSFETIAAAERDRLNWLRTLFGQKRDSSDQSNSAGRRYRGGDGGHLIDAKPLPQTPPRGPGGVAALPGDRPCINVTPEKVPERKGWLW